MGSQISSDIKYAYTNINGNRVPVPYVRLANGQWVPLQQLQQNWYSGYYNDSQRFMGGSIYGSPMMRNGSSYLYSPNNITGNDYYAPNQVYFNNGFLR